ncbi:MAG TPA: acyl-CoA desaturase [Microlunatus sp.]|nr:acyl-CoA desaturase [Microlunatus sp.]
MTTPTLTRPAQRTEHSHTELLRKVREAGLLKRARPFYFTLVGVLTLCLAAAATGGVLLGSSWFQLLIAAALGIVFTQFAFFSHEAAHRQVFASAKHNDRAALWVGSGLVGLSYSWWMSKHSRHHANPNQSGRDPDLKPGALVFEPEEANPKGPIRAALMRRQGYLFFPLLLLAGLGLHVDSVRSAFARGSRASKLERVLLILRLAGYPALILVLLGPGMGAAFLGVQVAVFGVYMGMSFAPNHKGMPIISAKSKLDFVRKQVLTSRNITGRGMTTFFGGLNYQIEHHLFPNMPRPHLAEAAKLVKEHCAQLKLPYTETTLVQSYARVVEYLNRVGLSARDPFDCPAARTLS